MSIKANNPIVFAMHLKKSLVETSSLFMSSHDRQLVINRKKKLKSFLVKIKNGIRTSSIQMASKPLKHQ